MAEGDDIAGGGPIPSGDPFLEGALREAREDADMFGRPRSPSEVMKRAGELYQHAMALEPDDVEPSYLSRRDAVALADELMRIEVKRRLAEAGVTAPVDKDTVATEERVAKRMRSEGWIMRSEVDSIIEKRATAKAVITAKDHLAWMKTMFLAILNTIVVSCLPKNWAMWWGLVMVGAYSVIALRLHRKWLRLIKVMEEEVGETVDPEDRSYHKPVILPTDAKPKPTKATLLLDDDE